jgi:hypothetical protein
VPLPLFQHPPNGLPLLTTGSASPISFTRLLIGSLALRPALLLFGNSRPRVTATPLPHATGAYGQLPGRDSNPLDLLLLLRTVRSCIHAFHLSNGLIVRFRGSTSVIVCNYRKSRSSTSGIQDLSYRHKLRSTDQRERMPRDTSLVELSGGPEPRVLLKACGARALRFRAEAQSLTPETSLISGIMKLTPQMRRSRDASLTDRERTKASRPTAQPA